MENNDTLMSAVAANKPNKQVSLFVATPMYGGQCYGTYMQSILSLQYLCLHAGIQLQVRIIGNESLIPRARNLLTREFLKSDATHLLFIDSDIEFNAPDVLRMLKADKPLIGGTYPGKKMNWQNIYNAANHDGIGPEHLKHFESMPMIRLERETLDLNKVNTAEPIEVRALPTGFMMIKREVFESLEHLVPNYPDPYAENPEEAEVTKIFFDTSMRGDDYLSEDYHFCYLYRDNGGKVYWAPWVVLNHIGTYTFQGGFNFAPDPEAKE